MGWQEVKYCDIVFDSFLCWGPTPAGEIARQNCPPARLSDTSRLAFRMCDESGRWVGRRPHLPTATGWTNYTSCFPTEVKTLFDKVESENDSQFKFEVAHRTRYMEIIGFSVSLVALLISLFIFTFFRSLQNTRTKIHKNLFVAMLLQVTIRLVLYTDQFLVRGGNEASSVNGTIKGIDNMPYLCETSYVLLEYFVSVMFMWMFIEGLYLNNMVTANVFKGSVSYRLYLALGWGLPLLIASIWSTFTALHYLKDNVNQCWYGYNFLNIYWIIQAPRLSVILINLIFLLNILKVLVVKLRRSQSHEVNKIRKAVRAAFVLLPLLGITNVLDMIEAPLAGRLWQFALWSYITHFLRSFQGFFIALIYCFMNAEVRTVIKKYFENQRAMRETRNRRASLFRKTGRRIANPTPPRDINISKQRPACQVQPSRPTNPVRSRTHFVLMNFKTIRSKDTQTGLALTHLTRPNLRRSLGDGNISITEVADNRRSTATYIETALMRRASCEDTSTIDITPAETTATIETVYKPREYFRRSKPSASCPIHTDAETSM